MMDYALSILKKELQQLEETKHHHAEWEWKRREKIEDLKSAIHAIEYQKAINEEWDAKEAQFPL